MIDTYIIVLKPDVSDEFLQNLDRIIETYNSNYRYKYGYEMVMNCLYGIKNVRFIGKSKEIKEAEVFSLKKFIKDSLSEDEIKENKLSILKFNDWNEVFTYLNYYK